MNQLLKDLLREAGGGFMVDRMERGECPCCGRITKDEKWRDEFAEQESKISGLCQKCQDTAFIKLGHTHDMMPGTRVQGIKE